MQKRWAGLTSVMLDASMDPYRGKCGEIEGSGRSGPGERVSVEAEIGHVGGVGETSDPDDTWTPSIRLWRMRCGFVQETGGGFLAVSIGTAHGLYKGTPSINFSRLHELRDRVSVPLVLHGGSSSGDENLAAALRKALPRLTFILICWLRLRKCFSLAGEGLREVEDYYRTKAAAKKGIQDCIRHCYELFATRP